MITIIKKLRENARNMFVDIKPTEMNIGKDIICSDWINKNYSDKQKLFKLCRMKIAFIFQSSATICDPEWIDNGSKQGLDLINHKKKIAIELKNSTKTDNNSSKNGNLFKLAEFKKSNKDYRVIYGYINGTSKIKNRIYNSETIECLYEDEILDLIYGRYKKIVINIIKKEFEHRMNGSF